VLTATVLDNGQPAANAGISVAKTSDPSGRGTLVAPTSGVTNSNGQFAVTLQVSADGFFSNFVVTVTSAAQTQSITIIDPRPLPPTNVQVSATDRLFVAWSPSLLSKRVGARSKVPGGLA
jgi:hypothetical protein